MLTPEVWEAVWLSTKVAFCSTILCLPFAIIVAWLLSHYEFKLKWIVEVSLQLTMVLPPVVLGYVLLIIFGQQGWIGQYLFDIGINFSFNWKGAVLVSMIVCFPFIVQPIRVAFQVSSRNIEDAAYTLGASFIQIFTKIHLPLALPGILIGSLMGFSRSLGEFGATITFVGNISGETRTIPIAIYSYLQQPDGEVMIMYLIFFSLGLSISALSFNYWLIKKYRSNFID